MTLHFDKASCKRWLMHLNHLKGDIGLSDILADLDGAPPLAQVLYTWPLTTSYCEPTFSVWPTTVQAQNFGGATASDIPRSRVTMNFSQTISFDSIGVS